MPLPKSKKWYSMKMLGATSAEIDIFGDIGQANFFNPDAISAKEFKAELESLGQVSEITVNINSYGGEICDGNAILTILQEHPASITTKIYGIAASQASVCAMAADPGKVQMAANGFFMIHNASMCVCGNKADMERYGKLLADMEANAIKAYQKHATKLTAVEIQELIDAETWMNAEDAKTYGFIDTIIEPVDVEEPATNTGISLPMNLKQILFKSKYTNGPQMRLTNKGERSMNKCPHCGKEHAEVSAFCAACGKPMDQKAAHDAEMAEARRAAAQAERERVSEIVARCQKHNLPADFQKKLIDENTSLDKAVVQILDAIEKKTPASPVVPDIGVGTDDADKFREHAQNSLAVALHIERDKKVVDDIDKNPGPRDLHSLVRACLVKEGHVGNDSIHRLTPSEIASHAIRMSMGSSDLPAILADTMNKEFKGGFEDAPTTFQFVTAETENPNFMSKSMTKLSGFSDIDELPEGTAFKEGKFSDKKETIQLSTFGKMLTLTRNLIINNDTGAIALFPRAMSSAMKQKMNRDFYDLLTYNTLVGPVTTEDGVAFFDDSAHGNYKGTSGVPSVATLGEADRKMMVQTLPKGEDSATQSYLNLVGSILLTGTANRMTVLQLIGSQNDPAATDGKLVVNPYAGRITPVFDAYLQAKLTAASLTYAWYLFAGPSIFRNWVVAYLSGSRTPTLRNKPSEVGEALGISYDIFFDYKFGFEEYRGVILNDGASGG